MGKIYNISIKAARVERGFTQESIAEKLGIGRDYYIKLENGQAEMKPVYIYAIAYLLKMDADFIRIPERV